MIKQYYYQKRDNVMKVQSKGMEKILIKNGYQRITKEQFDRLLVKSMEGCHGKEVRT